MYLQFVRSIGVQMRRHIDGEFEITASVKPGLMSIDENGGLVVDGAKVQQDLVVTRPR
jgi:hypothetical protein